MIKPGGKIAVVGDGVAGIVASYLLSREYDVVLYEKNDYLGGHTRTVEVTENDGTIRPVDTGFIVFNDHTYPNFIRFIEQLGVESRESNMSFSYYDEMSGFQYAGTNLNGLFAQRINIITPSFYRMLFDIRRFGKLGLDDLEKGLLEEMSLGDYVKKNQFSEVFTNQYLKPMGAAIWSTPAGQILDFPASNFVKFFRNHGLLSLTDRPIWRTIQGGSYRYVQAFEKQFSGQIRLHEPVRSIIRTDEGVQIETESNHSERYDAVVIAAHADQALRMLSDPSEREKELLGKWEYSVNKTELHTDATALPPLRNAWASWNYCKEKEATEKDPVSLSYYMNLLQGLETPIDYCVTLNRLKEIEREKVIKTIMYEHPIYTRDSVFTQPYLQEINGKQNTYFCGSYFNYGFHEDAVSSAVEVGKYFGISL